MANEQKRGNIWRLAQGYQSHSRQPSFAPLAARASVTIGSYTFGWNRNKGCFVISSRYDILASAQVKEYPCDRRVALGMLWLCARTGIVDRFLGGRHCPESDADVFAAAGHMFGVSVGSRVAEASLHFYSPAGELQQISLHDGMTASFRHTITGIPAAQIYRQLR